MKVNRRGFLGGALTLTGVASGREALAQEHPVARPAVRAERQRQGVPLPSGIVPVETPDLPKMPWHFENGVKVFNIAAELVKTEFIPGRTVHAWGFNGSMPGPTIEVNEGDRVRLIVENRLPEPFSMHWHGLEVPIGMDGAPGISQEPIAPGGRFVYDFTLHQNGTYFYHSHMAMQEMMGMIGFFIVHPREAYTPRVHRDFGLILQEWAILPNNTIPNTLAMEFNWLTMNGKAGPATTPMIVKLGERVRLRLVNLGMDHHPIHLHGNTFMVTGTEGGRIKHTTRDPGNTVLVGVGQARDFEFDAVNEGDWMLHCHMPHHMMNQMASMVGPIMMSHVAGLRPGDMTAGMGIVTGRALGEASSAALGRTLGVGAEAERPAPNMPLGSQQPTFMQPTRTAPNQGMFPGYPQDMLMAMDDAVAKPETYGLKPGWSAGMMGMMTLVRVVKPELFDKIAELKAERAKRA